MCRAAGDGDAGRAPRRSFTVAGVFDSGHYEYDSTLALLHIDDALAIANLPHAEALSVRLHDAQQAPEWARALAQRLDPRIAVHDWTRANRIWFAAVAQQNACSGSSWP